MLSHKRIVPNPLVGRELFTTYKIREVSLPPPNDIGSVLGHAATAGVAVIVAKLVGDALTIDSPAVGGGSDEVDGIIDAHIG